MASKYLSILGGLRRLLNI